MPFNGSGVFVRTENWSNDAANNLPISATKFDIEDNDFAGGFDLCLTRDGQGVPSSPLTWTQPLTLNRGSDGSVFAIGRTGGTNNPSMVVNVSDSGGFQFDTTIPTAIAFAIAGAPALTIGPTGDVVISAPTSGAALSVTAVGVQQAAIFNGSSGNKARVDFVDGQGSTRTWSLIAGQSAAGSFDIYDATAAAVRASFTSSSTALTVNGIAGQTAMGIVSASTNSSSDILVTRPSSNANALAQGPNLSLEDLGGATGTILQHSGGQTELWQLLSGTWHQAAFWNFNRGLTLNVPAAGSSLTVDGLAGTQAVVINSANTNANASVDLIVNRAGTQPNVVGKGAGIQLTDISATTLGSIIQHASGQTEFWQLNTGGSWSQLAFWDGNRVLNLVPSGAVANYVLKIAAGTNNIPIGLVFNGGSHPAFDFAGCVTGSATPTLTANKPGSNAGIVAWLPVGLGSSSIAGYIPIFG